MNSRMASRYKYINSSPPGEKTVIKMNQMMVMGASEEPAILKPRGAPFTHANSRSMSQNPRNKLKCNRTKPQDISTYTALTDPLHSSERNNLHFPSVLTDSQKSRPKVDDSHQFLECRLRVNNTTAWNRGHEQRSGMTGKKNIYPFLGTRTRF